MSKRGVPVSWFTVRIRIVMLMSVPNSVGIDPASANEDVCKATGRLVLPKQARTGRTAQFVAPEIKVSAKQDKMSQRSC